MFLFFFIVNVFGCFWGVLFRFFFFSRFLLILLPFLFFSVFVFPLKIKTLLFTVRFLHTFFSNYLFSLLFSFIIILLHFYWDENKQGGQITGRVEVYIQKPEAENKNLPVFAVLLLFFFSVLSRVNIGDVWYKLSYLL